MKKSQTGFTLIELVVVIVLLGILGVTALGRFQDLSNDASNAATTGVASELSAAAAINFAASTIGIPDVTITSTAGSTVDTGAGEACTAANLVGLFQSGAFPAGYALVANAADACTASGITYNCTVYSDDDADGVLDATEANAIATLICTGA